MELNDRKSNLLNLVLVCLRPFLFARRKIQHKHHEWPKSSKDLSLLVLFRWGEEKKCTKCFQLLYHSTVVPMPTRYCNQQWDGLIFLFNLKFYFLYLNAFDSLESRLNSSTRRNNAAWKVFTLSEGHRICVRVFCWYKVFLKQKIERRRGTQIYSSNRKLKIERP